MSAQDNPYNPTTEVVESVSTDVIGPLFKLSVWKKAAVCSALWFVFVVVWLIVQSLKNHIHVWDSGPNGLIEPMIWACAFFGTAIIGLLAFVGSIGLASKWNADRAFKAFAGTIGLLQIVAVLLTAIPVWCLIDLVVNH